MILLQKLRSKLPLINKIFSSNSQNQIFNLENIYFKIRIGIWCVTFTSTMISFFVENWTPKSAFIPFPLIYLFALYLLLTKKNEYILGLSMLVLLLSVTAGVLEKEGVYYLRMLTSCIGFVAIYSVMSYPFLLQIIMSGGYIFIQKRYRYHLSDVYEPITNTYRISANSIHDALDGWQASLIMQFITLMVYQIIVKKIWKSYKEVKDRLEQTNVVLQEVNAKLAKSVDELASTNKQLQDALESQKLFIACVSHEFRNPLNVLLGNIEILDSEIDSPDHSQRLKACKICGEALLGQINNLLDVAKIQAGKLEINETLTKMSSFLERVWTLAKAGLEKKGLNGNICVDKNLPLYLNIDAERLHQILDNLLSNAIKFTSAGSVRLNIQWIKGQHRITEGTLSGLLQEVSENSTTSREENNRSLIDLDEGKRKSFRAHPQYRKNDLLHLNDFISLDHKQQIKEVLDSKLAARSTEEYSILKIEVSDSGCGIPQEAQQKLFNPFIQADRSITRKYGGTGLGLYIAKILLEKMHGIIKMRSIPDIGAHFEIYLPLKPVTGPVLLNHPINSSQNLSKTMLKRIPKRNSQSCSFINQSEMTALGTSPMTGMSKKVLIVDDDASNRLILKNFFSKLKIEVDVANNGLEGFNIFCKNMGDYLAIAMDIQMPIMDGITAAKKIRKYENFHKIIKKTPIIFITGNCTQDEQSECLISQEIGESQFFKKPFRFSDCKLCLQRINPNLISDF